MGTRCIIGIADNLDQEKMRAVYCGHDGYPDGVGVELLRSYGSEDKILALLEGGAMSSLGDSPETTDYYGDEEASDYPIRRPSYETDIEYRYVFDRSTGTWYVVSWKDELKTVRQAIDEIEQRRAARINRT